MARTAASDVVDVLIDYGWRRMLQQMRLDCCIASTNVAIRVLRHFGIPAYPLPVKVLVFNPQYVKLIEAGNIPWATPGIDIVKWCDEHSAWSIGLGSGLATPERGRWDGHLIAIVPTLKRFIDMSIEQAARPHKGIFIEGQLVGQYPAQFPLHEKTIQFEATNGALMIYEATPERTEYTQAKDWKANVQDIVRDIIAQVRQEQR
jgi:hypothetical protein